MTDAGIYECSTVLTGEYLSIIRTTNLFAEYGITKVLAYSGFNVLKNVTTVQVPNTVNIIQAHENIKVLHPRINRSDRFPFNVVKPDTFNWFASEVDSSF